ncbi:MAG: helix-turn-helix transcriptional regulator [Candidatus Omnitrophica bacterium]|nr:helix-turn-helix transcriptional regulator [Candidatus Omnitrophota bacterium]
MTIGHRIKQLREYQGLSQTELAQKIGAKHPSTVSNWEQSKGEPNSVLRKKLCGIFGITEAELFTNQSSIKEPEAPYITSEIREALQDPIALQALLVTYKNTQEIKETIKALLETMPNLSPEKREAILALCK